MLPLFCFAVGSRFRSRLKSYLLRKLFPNPKVRLPHSHDTMIFLSQHALAFAFPLHPNWHVFCNTFHLTNHSRNAVPNIGATSHMCFLNTGNVTRVKWHAWLAWNTRLITELDTKNVNYIPSTFADWLHTEMTSFQTYWGK